MLGKKSNKWHISLLRWSWKPLDGMVTPRGASLLPLLAGRQLPLGVLRVIIKDPIELRSLVVSYRDDWVNFSSISFSRTPYWWRTCQLPKKPLSAFSRCCPNIIAAGLSEQDDFFFSKKFLCQKKDKRKFIQSSSWEKKCVSKRRRAPKKVLSRRKTSSLSSANFFFNLYFLDSFHFSWIRTSLIVTVILVAVSLIRFLINWEC